MRHVALSMTKKISLEILAGSWQQWIKPWISEFSIGCEMHAAL